MIDQYAYQCEEFGVQPDERRYLADRSELEMNRSGPSLLVACMLLWGCASFTEHECRTANWRYLGEQDARTHGLQPQINRIVHQCAKFGVQVPEQEYMRGWYDGNQQRALGRG